MKDCNCDLTIRNIVYVGRAVSMRNRLQSEFFDALSRTTPPWVDLYMQPPHWHILFASIWFVERPLLSVAEAVLIDVLNPKHNIRRKKGFSDQSLWPFRWPDLEGVSCLDIEPAKDRKPVNCPLNQKSGVYAWHYGDFRPTAQLSALAALPELFLSGHEKPSDNSLKNLDREVADALKGKS